MQFKYGTTTGTGAAINISCGFTPVFAMVINMTDGDRLDLFLPNMTAATGITIGAAVAAVGANGLSAYAGSESAAEGLTIGSAVSESAKVLAYFIVGE